MKIYIIYNYLSGEGIRRTTHQNFRPKKPLLTNIGIGKVSGCFAGLFLKPYDFFLVFFGHDPGEFPKTILTIFLDVCFQHNYHKYSENK